MVWEGERREEGDAKCLGSETGELCATVAIPALPAASEGRGECQKTPIFLRDCSNAPRGAVFPLFQGVTLKPSHSSGQRLCCFQRPGAAPEAATAPQINLGIHCLGEDKAPQNEPSPGAAPSGAGGNLSQARIADPEKTLLNRRAAAHPQPPAPPGF